MSNAYDVIVISSRGGRGLEPGVAGSDERDAR